MYYTVGYVTIEVNNIAIYNSFKYFFTKKNIAIDFMENKINELIKSKYHGIGDLNLNLIECDHNISNYNKTIKIDNNKSIIITPNSSGDTSVDIYIQIYKNSIFNLIYPNKKYTYPVYNFFVNKHEILLEEVYENQFKE